MKTFFCKHSTAVWSFDRHLHFRQKKEEHKIMQKVNNRSVIGLPEKPL